MLFISFIDDLVEYLEERCEPEPILDTLHCLLHADDTAILSTNRELFINKCNHMLDYFADNSLSLNLSKSGYLIINGKALTSSDKTQYLFSENLDIGAKKLTPCFSNSVFGPKIDVSAF